MQRPKWNYPVMWAVAFLRMEFCFRLECLLLHSLQKTYPISSAKWFSFLSFRKITNVREAPTKKVARLKNQLFQNLEDRPAKPLVTFPKSLQYRRDFQIQLVNSNFGVFNSLQNMGPLGMGLQHSLGNMDSFIRLDKTNSFFSLTKQGWEGKAVYKYI